MTSSGPGSSGSRPPLTVPLAALGLSVLAAVLGSLDWAVPARTASGWQVTDVPGPLLLLLVGTALGCLAAAAVLVPRACIGGPVALVAWWTAVTAAAATEVWNGLYYAAMSTDPGPIIPAAVWLFAFVPGLVAVVGARPVGRRAQLTAAQGTGVVTVPLLALAGALYDQGGGVGGGVVTAVANGLYTAVVFGVVPLVVAMALLRAPSRPAAVTG